jgi:hypothetical protein
VEKLISTVKQLETELLQARRQLATQPPSLPDARGASSNASILVYASIPCFAIVFGHYLMLYQLGFDRIYIVIYSIIIAALFGYDIFWRMRYGPIAALCIGSILGSAAFIATSTVVKVNDGVAIFPDSIGGWQLTIEFVIGIALGTVSGNAIASTMFNVTSDPVGSRNRLYEVVAKTITASMGPPKAGQTVADRLASIEKTVKAATAVFTAIGALITGIKSVFHLTGG